MSLYVFNNQQEVIKIIPYRRIVALRQEQELNSTDELNLEIPNEDWLTMEEEPSYMAVKDVYSRYSYHLYKVIQDKTGTHTSEIRGIQVGFDELKAYGYIKDRRFSSYSVRRVAEVIVEGTDWELGYVSDSLPTVSTNFYYISRLESLSKLIELTGAEVQFRVEINGNKISAKRMDLYEKLGKDTGKRFAYGDRLLSVTKETDNVGVVTALVGRGRGEETETGGFGRKITFTDVEWGEDKPVVKPRGQEYVEIPEMTALYGYKDGTPRYGIAEFNDTEDPEELLEQTYRALVDMSRPQVQFKASVQVVGDLGLGDTVAIIRKDVGIQYKTRVYKVVRDLLNNNRTVVELGDKVGQSVGKTLGKIVSTVKEQREEMVNIVQTAANGKNRIYRGEQEPTSGMMVGDLWYKPIADGEVEMYQWNGTIWELIITSGVNEELEQRLDQAHKDIEDARAEAEKALDEINTAVDNAGFTSLDETIRNAKDLAIEAQEDAQYIIDNKGQVLGLDAIDKAIEDIENPASDTWRDILESDRGHIVQYTQENNEGVLTSASGQTAEQIATALSEYTETEDLDGHVATLLESESSQTAGKISDKLTSYVESEDLDGSMLEVLESESSQTAGHINNRLTSYVSTDSLDGRIAEVLTSETSQTAGKISDKLTSYTTHEDLGVVETKVNRIDSTASSTKVSMTQIWDAVGMGNRPGEDEPVSLKFLDLEASVDGLELKVGDTSSGLVSQYNQLAEGFRSTVEDVNGLTSTVGQMSDKWVMTLEGGDDIVTAINASRDGVYVKGEKIVLDGDTTIAGSFTVTDTIFANEMNISKFTTGTLNAGNVDIINLNVDSLVGNKSQFVQSAWNDSFGANMEITGSKLESRETADAYADTRWLKIQTGSIKFGDSNVGEAVEVRGYGYRKRVTIPGGGYTEPEDVLDLQVRLKRDSAKFIVGNTSIVGDIEMLVFPQLEVGEKEGVTVDLRYGVPEKYHETGTEGLLDGMGGEFLRLYRGVATTPRVMTSMIDQANNLVLGIPRGDFRTSLNIRGKQRIDIMIGRGREFNKKIRINEGEVIYYQNINMNGNTIINQSDIRLKKDIRPTNVNAIREIDRLEFIDYVWDKEKKPDSPDGEQFGIKAQYAPFLQVKADEEESYLSIDMNKQVNLNSKAIQEVIAILKNNNLMGEI